MLVNFEQCSNADSPIEVTELGMVNCDSVLPRGYKNSDVRSFEYTTPSIDAYLLFSVDTFISVKSGQLSNAEFPIEVTELPIVTLVKRQQLLNAEFPIEVTEFGIVTLVKPVHSLNAYSPIEVTEFGIVTLVKTVHSLNAYSPIEVTV